MIGAVCVLNNEKKGTKTDALYFINNIISIVLASGGILTTILCFIFETMRIL